MSESIRPHETRSGRSDAAVETEEGAATMNDLRKQLDKALAERDATSYDIYVRYPSLVSRDGTAVPDVVAPYATLGPYDVNRYVHARIPVDDGTAGRLTTASSRQM